MGDSWNPDFTPILKLESRKNPDIYRVYILDNGKWRRYSKHKNDLSAYIVKDVKVAEGFRVKITYKRKVIFESKEVACQ